LKKRNMDMHMGMMEWQAETGDLLDLIAYYTDGGNPSDMAPLSEKLVVDELMGDDSRGGAKSAGGDTFIISGESPSGTRVQLPVQLQAPQAERLIKPEPCEEFAPSVSRATSTNSDARLSAIAGEKDYQVIEVDGKQRFACVQCSATFDKKYNLFKHVRNLHMSKDKSFKCQQCSSMFHQKDHLRKHMNVVHEKKRDHACPHCDAKFGWASCLKKHIDYVHRNIRQNVCDRCGSAFGQRSHLLKHIESVHDGKQSYACLDCNMRYTRKRGLTLHIQSRGHRAAPDALVSTKASDWDNASRAFAEPHRFFAEFIGSFHESQESTTTLASEAESALFRELVAVSPDLESEESTNC